MSLEDAQNRISERIRKRQEAVAEAFRKHMPDFPVDDLRKTFGARVESVRSPTIDYGPEPERGIVAGPLWYHPWVIPKPPKGDYPAVVAFMSEAKRRFLTRLKRVRRAGKIKAYEYRYKHEQPDH